MYSADDSSAGYVNGIYVLVRSTGLVTWPVQVRVRSLCDVDMTYFPFDDQLCSLRFGSWLYSDQHVVFNVCQRIVLISFQHKRRSSVNFRGKTFVPKKYV